MYLSTPPTYTYQLRCILQFTWCTHKYLYIIDFIVKNVDLSQGHKKVLRRQTAKVNNINYYTENLTKTTQYTSYNLVLNKK